MWKIFIIAFVWLMFLSCWVAGLFIYRTKGTKKRDRSWLVSLISIFPVVFIAGHISGHHLIRRFDLPFNSLNEIVGVFLLIFGLFLGIWARLTLGRFWSGVVAFIEGQPVVKSGPYSIVRHPIYTGVIMMLWGSVLLESYGFAMLIAFLGTFLLALKAKFEERLLEKHLDEYRNYKKEVESSFIPG